MAKRAHGRPYPGLTASTINSLLKEALEAGKDKARGKQQHRLAKHKSKKYITTGRPVPKTNYAHDRPAPPPPPPPPQLNYCPSRLT